MSTQSETRSAERKPVKARKGNNGSLHEMQDIKEEVMDFARNIRDTSTDKAHAASDYVHDRVDDLKDSGTAAIEKVEKRIKSRPSQSIAIAFTAGLIASYLLGRRAP